MTTSPAEIQAMSVNVWALISNDNNNNIIIIKALNESTARNYYRVRLNVKTRK